MYISLEPRKFFYKYINMEPEKSLLKEFLQGGWVVPLIGAGAMLARLLSGENNYTWWQQLKKILTYYKRSALTIKPEWNKNIETKLLDPRKWQEEPK